MRPIAYDIEGEYWDSWVYRGRLYLFTIDGKIITVDWDRLINEFNSSNSDIIFLRKLFLSGEFLYKFKELFQDKEFKELVKLKIDRLSKLKFEIGFKDLQKFVVDTQDTPLPFPHADCSIYLNQVFCGNENGLVQTALTQGKSRHIKSRSVSKLWDGPVMSLSMSYNTAAISGGEEGAFEYDLKEDSILQRWKTKCKDVEWMWHNLFISSDEGPSRILEYSKSTKLQETEEDEFEDAQFQKKETVRTLGHEIDLDQIFTKGKQRGFSWGAKDKLYLLQDKDLSIYKYNPWTNNEKGIVSLVTSAKFESSTSNFVSGKVAPFGTILELDDKLIVIGSDGVINELSGEPVNWRVFPRAKHYDNHLHAVYDDYLSVMAFGNDYFVDQSNKVYGTYNVPKY